MKKFLALAVVALVSFSAFCYEEPTKPSPEEVILQNGGHIKTNPLYVCTLATEEWVTNQLANATVDASNKFITCEIGKYFTTNVTIGSVRRVEMNIEANAEEGYIRINEGTPFSYNTMLGLTNIVLALDSVVYEFVPEPLDNGGLKINCKSATGINTNIMFSASEAVPYYATNLVDALDGARMNNAIFDGSVFFNGEIRQTFSNVKDSNEKSLKSYLDERLTSTEAERIYINKDNATNLCYTVGNTTYRVLSLIGTGDNRGIVIGNANTNLVFSGKQIIAASPVVFKSNVQFNSLVVDNSNVIANGNINANQNFSVKKPSNIKFTDNNTDLQKLLEGENVNPIAKLYDDKKEVTWDVVMVGGEMKIFATSPYDETEYLKVNSVMTDKTTRDNWNIRMDDGEMKFKTKN